jgi:pimeloyl-ACP methyl ester carboxylesterase
MCVTDFLLLPQGVFMKHLLCLAILAVSPFAMAKPGMNCVNQSDGSKVNIELSSSRVSLKLDGENKKSFSFKRITNSGRLYKSGSAKVRVEVNGSASQIVYSPNIFKKIIISDCKKIVETPVEVVTKIPIETLGPASSFNYPQITTVDTNKGKLFNKYGKLTKIKYQPATSPLNFQYDLVYYIPQKLKGKKDLKTLVFLHGGGASTSDRSGSLDVIDMYAADLKSMADTLGFVLVMPSGSGLNWGAHMFSYLRDLNQSLRNDLYLDPNGIGLTGHSMGGMGITRAGHWLTDDYAFFMPVAAGMDEKHQIEKNLLPYFNMKYYHLQGLQDHFSVFISRCKKQEKALTALEKKLGKKSGFVMDFYNGSHNYPKTKYKNILGSLFKDNSRDLYQTELSGMFYYRKEIYTDRWSNGNDYYQGPRDRYFWLKATEFSAERTVVEVKAKIESNTIKINVGPGVKSLRVYLSSKNLDLSKEVEVIANGAVKFKGIAPTGQNMTAELKRDAGYVFEGFVDIVL